MYCSEPSLLSSPAWSASTGRTRCVDYSISEIRFWKSLPLAKRVRVPCRAPYTFHRVGYHFASFCTVILLWPTSNHFRYGTSLINWSSSCQTCVYHLLLGCSFILFLANPFITRECACFRFQLNTVECLRTALLHALCHIRACLEGRYIFVADPRVAENTCSLVGWTCTVQETVVEGAHLQFACGDTRRVLGPR